MSPHETRVTPRSPTLPACPSDLLPVRRDGTRSWLVAAWFAVSAAGAQVPDERALLGEVPSVFAASKYDQPLSEAPADVTIVTRAEIQRYGWLTLADVLRGVRGFLVTSFPLGDRITVAIAIVFSFTTIILALRLQ